MCSAQARRAAGRARAQHLHQRVVDDDGAARGDEVVVHQLRAAPSSRQRARGGVVAHHAVQMAICTSTSFLQVPPLLSLLTLLALFWLSWLASGCEHEARDR